MIRRLIGALAAVGVALVVSASPSIAASSFSLFGDAQRVHAGHNSRTAIQLRSSTISPGYGGIDFKVPSGTMFSQITNLATDYKFTVGSCGGGAPRFQINVDGHNAFVYIGPPPNYTGCPLNVWVVTGNLVAAASFVDTSQLPGGAFYDTFAAADLKYGSHVVTGIQLVTDGSWAVGGTQIVLVDNVMINTSIYTFDRGHGEGDGGGEDNNGNNGDNGDNGDNSG